MVVAAESAVGLHSASVVSEETDFAEVAPAVPLAVASPVVQQVDSEQVLSEVLVVEDIVAAGTVAAGIVVAVAAVAGAAVAAEALAAAGRPVSVAAQVVAHPAA